MDKEYFPSMGWVGLRKLDPWLCLDSRSWWRTCRACCTACATQHVRLFPTPKS